MFSKNPPSIYRLASLALLTLVLAGCNDDELNSDSDVYRYVADNPTIETGAFAYIDDEDFLASSGTSTAQSRTLASCAILDNPEDRPCSIAQLPFLASESLTPSKQQILDRLIVSHPWMAANFSQLLDLMPSDMYRLFASTTAIVIHAEIRPAFFWSQTGAIYLDPQYLWLTQAQKDTVSQEQDYRSGFGSDLQFMALARYSIDGEFAFSYSSPRSINDALHSLSALLFHELAHANDFFPADRVANADVSQTPLNLVNLSMTTSAAIDATYPLQDDSLHRLANVLFRGATASDDLLALSASDVGLRFEIDGANDDYGYLETPYPQGLHYEDTAMLFEEVMMKIHYNIDREIAYATPLVENVLSCNQLSLDWSRINRYRDAEVLPRAQLAVDSLLPNHEHTDFLNNPPPPGVYRYCVQTNNRQRSSLENQRNKTPLQRHFWH